ncbi:tRNA-Thr(GGU) m(6)t(6)A37 methyltransferase TsaA [Roseovarius sp. MBR-78]|jgi:tRNA-Thr(GGU) m(6)t(6)A37 methyltransferase TsaA|uniref:tRNA (N6-threonylcarbamoyladenosine(37)-N6)-methyltransferase TrmO n=1 Tax=Roseovarius sp. MBR-78 TaxID=3156460 RepID=UPI003398C4E2
MESRVRAGERLVEVGPPTDAALYFIGRIHTPWAERKDCPRQGRVEGPECRVEVFAPWAEALMGVAEYGHLDLLYWLDRARRDLVVQNPKNDGERYFGTFALRSPQRPNPIGLSRVRLVAVERDTLVVRGLDCLDGTPLIDIKPVTCDFTPKAPPKP